MIVLSLIALILLYFIIFFLSIFQRLSLKIYVIVFSRTIQARTFKLGLLMNNEMLNRRITFKANCFYSSLSLSIFLSFQDKFVSQFSHELCKLGSSNWI